MEKRAAGTWQQNGAASLIMKGGQMICRVQVRTKNARNLNYANFYHGERCPPHDYTNLYVTNALTGLQRAD